MIQVMARREAKMEVLVGQLMVELTDLTTGSRLVAQEVDSIPKGVVLVREGARRHGQPISAEMVNAFGEMVRYYDDGRWFDEDGHPIDDPIIVR